MNEDNIDRNVINTYNGGQVIVANDNATVYAVQNNCRVNANSCVKFQNNKKQDYIDNWNSRLFLHTDNDERPITLADAFIMPGYKYYTKSNRIKLSVKDTMDKVIEKFVQYGRSENMLVTGVPGIGKTSIVSWMANEYKENNNIIVLRFRDWDRGELDDGLFKAICDTLDCRKRNLENKIIILDGFDEIKTLNNGEDLIRDFLNGILDFKNMKAIITSRTNYIKDNLFENSISLLPFQIEDIKRFYGIITGDELINDSDYSNLDVLGIPVILYMAIMSDIDITKKVTKPELYSRIFAEKGGIFDKFSYKGNGYDHGNQILRDSKNIKIYLRFLQDIAFKMFDESKLYLPRRDEEIPKLTFQGAEVSVLEFPIKHLFDNTISNIEFVHKSIYEYFVAEYIIQSISNLMDLNDYKEKIACFFGKELLLHEKISSEILEFIRYKIRNNTLNDRYDKIAEAFQLMLKDGMLYYTNVCYKNVVECELTVFEKMLDVLHLWGKKSYKFNDIICSYIRYNYKYCLNLNAVELRRLDLRGVNLEKANLREANLRGTNLGEANLRGANLKGANLIGANLRGASLEGAQLYQAIFDEGQVGYLREKYKLNSIKVFISKTNEIIKYSEYCKKYI